jgi:hypothetical protein
MTRRRPPRFAPASPPVRTASPPGRFAPCASSLSRLPAPGRRTVQEPDTMTIRIPSRRGSSTPSRSRSPSANPTGCAHDNGSHPRRLARSANQTRRGTRQVSPALMRRRASDRQGRSIFGERQYEVRRSAIDGRMIEQLVHQKLVVIADIGRDHTEEIVPVS